MAEDGAEESEKDMRRRLARERQPAELGARGAAHDAADTPSTEPDLDVHAKARPPIPEPPPGMDPVDYWRDAVLTESSSSEARRRLAYALLARGEEVLAAEQLEAARAAQPDDVTLLVELAQIQTSLRRFDAAERELRRGLKVYPDVSDVHLSLGIISYRRGLYTQAEQELKRAVELDSESAAAFFYRGEALNQLNRADEALEMLERAARLQPGNARTYYLMGIVYDKKSRPQEAAAMYRRAREAGGA